jgi:hypothetical protein
MSDHRSSYLTREFAAYMFVSAGGFAILWLLLMDSGLEAYWILAIGMAYGEAVDEIKAIAKSRMEERRGNPTSEEVSA